MAFMSRSAALTDARIWLVLSWAGVALFALALAVLLLLGRWQELRIAACFFVPLLVAMLVPHGLPNLFLAVIAACFLISAAGWAWDWYARWWWFDVALHLLNPFAMVAGSMFMLWKADFIAAAPRQGRFVLVSTLFGLALGGAWELFELTYLELTWPDTILDIAMDTAGAALGGWCAAWVIAIRGVPPKGRLRLADLRARAARRPFTAGLPAPRHRRQR